MASPTQFITPYKVVAIWVGAGLVGLDAWLNAEFIAQMEGWASSLVWIVIATTSGAAFALPMAEQAAKTRQPAKAVGLVLFFAIMMMFSISTAIDRLGSRRDNEAHRTGNIQAKLAQEAYAAAKLTADAECARRGPKCRAAEDAVNKAREALSSKPAERVEDSMAVRIAAALPFLTVEAVQLYQPLVLPLGLQLGGFLMLALGLSPKREPEPKPVAKRRSSRRAAAKAKVRRLGTVLPFPACHNATT